MAGHHFGHQEDAGQWTSENRAHLSEHDLPLSQQLQDLVTRLLRTLIAEGRHPQQPLTPHNTQFLLRAQHAMVGPPPLYLHIGPHDTNPEHHLTISLLPHHVGNQGPAVRVHHGEWEFGLLAPEEERSMQLALHFMAGRVAH